MDEGVFSVEQVNRAIGAALSASFPDPFWVVGEVQGHDRDAVKAGQRRWGQVYFELVEKDGDAEATEGAGPGAASGAAKGASPGAASGAAKGASPGAASGAAKASVKAVLWGDARRKVMDRLAATAGDVRLQDGLKVKFLCAVDFYWPRASLQLKVLDVDPQFTLGDLERSRRELVEALKREGLLDANRALPFPLVPLEVGLITSEGSAAHHDFVQQLRASGYGFAVRLADARMQGEETEESVLAALRRLEADPAVEVIVLARGGGSRSDLMWFDRERIARAVARCVKPVVTGIGHEIDVSVSDLVAFQSLKTPTAAAVFLVEKVRDFDARVAAAAGELRRGVLERLAGAGQDLRAAARTWRPLVQARLERAGGGLAESRRALAAGARGHISFHRERLKGAPLLLGRGARERLARQAESLESFKKECAWKDPRRLLTRGYSLLYAGDRLVKSISGLPADGRLTTQLSDGCVESKVERIVP